MKAKTQRIAMLIALGLTIFLLIALAVCEILPATNGNNDRVIQQQADFQLARDEFLVKNVYALEYRPVQHVQAVGELQIQLPAFEKAQTGLLNGDVSLGLPRPSNGVKTALLDAQSDYLAIDAAVRTILLHPDATPDPIQTNIVAMHERPYTAAMYTVITLLAQEEQARSTQLLILEITLIALALIVILLKYLLFTQPVIKQRIAEEAAVNSLIKAASQ